MKHLLIVLALVLITSSIASGQASGTGVIGLWVDDMHSENCVYGSGFAPIEMYCWCEPGDSAIYIVEFMTLYPDNIIEGAITCPIGRR